jgi:hypothetical protein
MHCLEIISDHATRIPALAAANSNKEINGLAVEKATSNKSVVINVPAEASFVNFILST